jgi:hypothetical protein
MLRGELLDLSSSAETAELSKRFGVIEVGANRNPAIIGVLEQIRRSEGKYRRRGKCGWQSLTDGDRAEFLGPKTPQNIRWRVA